MGWGGKREGAGRKLGDTTAGWNVKEAIRLREQGLTFKVIAERVGAPSLAAVWSLLKLRKANAPIQGKPHIRKKHVATEIPTHQILSQGRVYESTTHRRKCLMVTHEGIVYIHSHVVWLSYNPMDTILENEIIHHIDFNSLNDHITNLIKVTEDVHRRLHASIAKKWPLDRLYNGLMDETLDWASIERLLLVKKKIIKIMFDKKGYDGYPK